MGTLIKHRTCDGNCSYETFQVVRTLQEKRKVRQGRYRDCCKTGFRPYDLAVQCVLLVSKQHLKDRIQVWSGGGDYATVDQATHNRIVSFIWGIAEDVLRDLFKRGNTRMQHKSFT
jgi:hypothetical protein